MTFPIAADRRQFVRRPLRASGQTRRRVALVGKVFPLATYPMTMIHNHPYIVYLPGWCDILGTQIDILVPCLKVYNLLNFYTIETLSPQGLAI